MNSAYCQKWNPYLWTSFPLNIVFSTLLLFYMFEHFVQWTHVRHTFLQLCFFFAYNNVLGFLHVNTMELQFMHFSVLIVPSLWLFHILYSTFQTKLFFFYPSAKVFSFFIPYWQHISYLLYILKCFPYHFYILVF